MKLRGHCTQDWGEVLSLCLLEASSVSETGVAGLSPIPSLANPTVEVIPCTLSDIERNRIVVSTWKFKYRRDRKSLSATLPEIGSVS